MGYFQVSNPTRGFFDEIEELCRQVDWSVDEQDGKKITLFFKSATPARRRKLYIMPLNDGNIASFYCFSLSQLRAHEVPNGLYAALLCHNQDRLFGSWRLDDEDPEFSFLINAAIPVKGLTAPLFEYVCTDIVKEVEALDMKLHQDGLLMRR